MTTRTAHADSRATERHQVYLDALKAAAWAPDTVCVSESHYAEGRHPVPYRMGYCHNQGQPNEHWHAGEREHLVCPDRQMRRYSGE